MTDELREKTKDILNYYGEIHQQEKAIEEMGELICAIKHGDRKNYVEELADVLVMITQLEQALNFEEHNKFIVTVHEKVERQLSRIKRNGKNGRSKTLTLCWKCSNMNCSWMRRTEPVNGWNAESTVISQSDYPDTPSFHVFECPEFKEGKKK